MTSKTKRKSSSSSTSTSNNSTPPTSPQSHPQPPTSHPPPSSPSPPSISPFISKLYSIVSNPSTQSIIHWAPHGDSFLVTNEYHFSSIVMKQHFRHSNFSSFVRQLNFYGFHKRGTQGGATQFDHPHFKRGREDLLHLIVRKSGGTASGPPPQGGDALTGVKAGKNDEGVSGYRDEIQQLTTQVRQLKAQYADLAKMQQRILYVFGRYMSGGTGGEVTGGKRYVSEDEEGVRRDGGGGSAAKKARLLIENREASQAGEVKTGEGRGGRRGGSFPNPLADIDWNDPHAMQDLIHSPYMRGAPQVLNTTPMPIELPPLQGGPMPRAVSAQGGTRSPRPLLLTGGEAGMGRDGGRRLTLPPIEVRRRQGVIGRGVFYDAGDSPSSQSSTSTEAEEKGARSQPPPLSFNEGFTDPSSNEQQWFNSAHLAPNGVIYCAPTKGEEGGEGGDRSLWSVGDQVKVEGEYEPVSPSPFGFVMPSTPPPLDPLPLPPNQSDLDQPPNSPLPLLPSLPLSPLPLPADGRGDTLSPYFTASMGMSTVPTLSLTPTHSPLQRYEALSQPVITQGVRSMAR